MRFVVFVLFMLFVAAPAAASPTARDAQKTSHRFYTFLGNASYDKACKMVSSRILQELRLYGGCRTSLAYTRNWSLLTPDSLDLQCLKDLTFNIKKQGLWMAKSKQSCSTPVYDERVEYPETELIYQKGKWWIDAPMFADPDAY